VGGLIEQWRQVTADPNPSSNIWKGKELKQRRSLETEGISSGDYVVVFDMGAIGENSSSSATSMVSDAIQ
jgi:hypothetical protein